MTQATRNAFRSASITAGLTFVVLFLTSSLGVLAALARWASSNGRDPLPDISLLGYAAVNAIVAGLTGLLNFVIRWSQGRLGVGKPPTY